MAVFETEALVLRSYNLAEADKIVVCLSRSTGLIRGVAVGRATIAFGGGGTTRCIICIARAIPSRRDGSFSLHAHGNLAGAATFVVARNRGFAQQATRRLPVQAGVAAAALGQSAAGNDSSACVAAPAREDSASHANRRWQQGSAFDGRDACRRDTRPPPGRRGETRNRRVRRVAGAGERCSDGGRVRRDVGTAPGSRR